ncbi:hypothetical protein Q3G72_024077 [Acer saccharum]|nr:hypothetical protein Q3G72_024077 [Acer saccharum]
MKNLVKQSLHKNMEMITRRANASDDSSKLKALIVEESCQKGSKVATTDDVIHQPAGRVCDVRTDVVEPQRWRRATGGVDEGLAAGWLEVERKAARPRNGVLVGKIKFSQNDVVL